MVVIIVVMMMMMMMMVMMKFTNGLLDFHLPLKIEVEFMQKVGTVGIFLQKYTEDISAETHRRYFYWNAFLYKLICAEICAQMGLGDFCSDVQRTQDGGGVYAKSRDKRNPPLQKYKKTSSQNTNYKSYRNANTSNEKKYMCKNMIEVRFMRKVWTRGFLPSQRRGKVAPQKYTN